jgi:uncharacterized protein (DUF1778 family)
MPPIGRPPSSNPRRNAVPIRLTDDEHAAIKAAADKLGWTVGRFVRDKALAAAKRTR